MDEPELGALLEAVGEFAQAEISKRAGPDRPSSGADLAAIEQAAAAMGLLDREGDGTGLWTAGPGFTALALRILARRSSGAALHLHLTALADVASRELWGAPTQAGTTIVMAGSHGLGGAALGRVLAGIPFEPGDADLLDGLYGAGPRLRWAAASGDRWLAPRIDGGKFELAEFNGRGSAAGALLGPDGPSMVLGNATDSVRATALDCELHAELLACHQSGVVAITQGAADTAAGLAATYARDRVQGGSAIAAHDAVALLLAGQQAQISTIGAQALVAAAAEGGPTARLAASLALRLAAAPALAAATDAAVQVHGGSGYMRDTGVEHLWRDTQALRLIGGAPDDLALVLAGLTISGAGIAEPPAAPGAIAGHLPADAPLAPQPAFRNHPVLRRMSAYEVRDGWERDTRELPRPLRGYRRQLRDFARSHVTSLALTMDLEMRDSDARPPELDAVLGIAGRHGLLTDLLPRPLGSAPARRYRTSLVLQQALRTEELAAADGGLMLLLSAHNLGLAPVLFSANRHAFMDAVRPALKSCAAGDPQIFAFAITEPGAGSDAEDGHGAAASTPGVMAVRAAGGWELHGSKVFISGGDRARWVVVFAALEGEGFDSWTAFLVDAAAPGFARVRNEHKMGMRASAATALAFDGCFVPDELVLGGLRGGWALSRATLNFSRLPVAAMSVGFARRATEIATEFACRERVAGRPLIDRQHVQLALADMQAETDAIRSLVWQFARRRVPEQAKASIAKFHAGDRAQVVIERAMGLLGEHGLLHENELEKVLRDNRLTRIFEGTNQINRLAVIEDQQELLLAASSREPQRRAGAR